MKTDLVTHPVTKDSLIAELRKLGVSGNQIIEVHCRLSSCDYGIGGASTVVDALLEIAEDGGTILMPTHVAGNSEPSGWSKPAVTPSLYQEMRAALPAFDPKSSYIYGMGAVAENFRQRPGVIISSHPNVSYAAWGRYAKLLCNRQSLHFPLSEESPCARLYELKGSVLLLGSDFDTCTCMHLAEYRSDCRPICISAAKIKNEDGDEWKKYLDLKINNEAFMKIKKKMQEKKMIKESELGGCHIQFFSAAKAVDEATKYFEKTVVYDLYR